MLAVVRPASATRAAFAAFAVPPGYLTAGADDVGFLADDSAVAVAVPVGAPGRSFEQPVDDVRNRRLRALTAHATQVEVLPGGFALSNRIAQPLPETEFFRLLAGDPPPVRPDGTPPDDVFAGLA